MAKRGRGRPKKITSDNSGQAMAESSGGVPYSDKLPEFFTFYSPSVCSERMRIPPEFVPKFGGAVPTVVTLKMPTGISLQVGINRIHDHLYLQQGWPEFVEENLLEDRDILTFCYVGNSVFYVKIYTMNGCKKRVDDVSRINNEPVENLQGNESSESENSKENKATQRTAKRNLSPRRSISRKSHRNPSFTVVMSKYYLSKGCMHIPKEFWREYIEHDRKGSRMVNLWMRNKSWPVGLSIQVDRVHFSRGWGNFVLDNSLRNGNVCTFQLIDSHDYDFKVTVSR